VQTRRKANNIKISILANKRARPNMQQTTTRFDQRSYRCPHKHMCIQHALLRDIKEIDTVAMAIKKRLKYKSAYVIGHIRVHMVMKALNHFCKMPFYKMEKVSINDTRNEMFNEDKTLEPYDIDIDNVDGVDTIDEELVMKTLLHGFIDAHSIYDLEKNQINIALGEWHMPLGIL
jgi:hypothetical protein